MLTLRQQHLIEAVTFRFDSLPHLTTVKNTRLKAACSLEKKEKQKKRPSSSPSYLRHAKEASVFGHVGPNPECSGTLALQTLAAVRLSTFPRRHNLTSAVDSALRLRIAWCPTRSSLLDSSERSFSSSRHKKHTHTQVTSFLSTETLFSFQRRVLKQRLSRINKETFCFVLFF